jgi:hypothetical protein
MDTGHWICETGVSLTDETFGFVYEITNNINKRIYIGKKQCFKKVKYKPLKNKKNKRIQTKDSDWKTYTGSCTELNDDIKSHGLHNFTFKILKTCSSKWELAYEEIKEQINREVLLKEEYYNGIINVRIGTPPRALFEKIVK